jgi:DNA-binding response OmpR family regulator
MREVFAALFADEGLGVLTAATREETQMLLAEHRVSAIVLDVGLGEPGDGERVLEDIAALACPPPSVLLSALRSRVEPLAKKFGVPFLTKPFDLPRLHAAVLAALENGLRPQVAVA